MEQFPHLKFVQKVEGKPRFHGGGTPNQITIENKKNRQKHSQKLKKLTTSNKKSWVKANAIREEANLPELNLEIIPIFIKFDPDKINAEFDLESFGIEVISEEEDGYIIGASLDNFRSLEEKIDSFIEKKHGSGQIANFWEIFEGNRDEWRPKHILSEELFKKWNDIKDDATYKLEVSIAFAKPIEKAPDRSTKQGETRFKKYQDKLIERDNILIERENHFEKFIRFYGEKTSEYVDLGDSFGCEVSITGKGLKDLVVNYQFVFEVSEIEEVSGIEGSEGEISKSEIEILPPHDDSIEVGVIDSGIMESHRYLSPAIRSHLSKSYIESDDSTMDYVKGGGHGTKVAGAILYPSGISGLESPYRLPFFIRNLKILDRNNSLIDRYPAALIQKIANDNPDCKLFNLSVSSKTPFRTKHMSSWAAIIDKISNESDVLFITSAGNITAQEVSYFLKNGKSYPSYLEEKFSRLANPSQSSFCISVGSVNHVFFEDDNWESIGDLNEVSAFSRIGNGIWDTIKPDVVEYGGGLVISQNGQNHVKSHSSTSPELVNSTLDGSSAVRTGNVGTSFSTPKVTHIAATLKQLYPEENSCLIRSLIAQGARLPNSHFLEPNELSLKHFGYGIPSLERVTKNTDYRITFYNTGEISAEQGHLYSLKIPEAMRAPGEDYDILIEISLAFSAKVRRTRQRTKSYLSTWLDWSTSKIGESFEEFKDYALLEIDEEKTEYDKENRKQFRNYNWKIKSDKRGSVDGINRTNSSLQKDWTIVKSYELPEEIGLSVRGHKGWDKNKSKIPYGLSISIEILGANIPIYEVIRAENEIEIEV
ncbi:S8 family peptidase [Marivirga sp.]|uniref:S8 family peptidase n=1 Tax=Marivirga sp. TaxID=2018662 RepID=UPI0025D62CF1|nr:S8 family peptidase [Marivirga sp.]